MIRDWFFFFVGRGGDLCGEGGSEVGVCYFWFYYLGEVKVCGDGDLGGGCGLEDDIG